MIRLQLPFSTRAAELQDQLEAAREERDEARRALAIERTKMQAATVLIAEYEEERAQLREMIRELERENERLRQSALKQEQATAHQVHSFRCTACRELESRVDDLDEEIAELERQRGPGTPDTCRICGWRFVRYPGDVPRYMGKRGGMPICEGCHQRREAASHA